jgi:hypothetical protein
MVADHGRARMARVLPVSVLPSLSALPERLTRRTTVVVRIGLAPSVGWFT